MLDSPIYRITDEAAVRELVRAHGFVTVVSPTSRGLVASHVPVTVEESEELVLTGHFGRPDDENHELGSGTESMIVVQGTHGYVSASWYGSGPTASTWDFAVVHLHGVLEPVLDPQENLEVLMGLQRKYEEVLPEPMLMERSPEIAEALARGARAFRMKVTRWQGRNKMSQNRPAEVVERVVEQLDADPAVQPYANPELAALVRRANPGVG